MTANSLLERNNWKYKVIRPVGKMDARQRFIYEAATRFGLSKIGKPSVGEGVTNPQVEEHFYNAMQSFALPSGSQGNWNRIMGECSQRIFVHLVACRLQGATLPLPVEKFHPDHMLNYTHNNNER